MKIRTPYLILSLSLGAASVANAQFYTADGGLESINNSGFAAGYNGSGYETWTPTGGITTIGGQDDAGNAIVSADSRYVGGDAVNPSTGFSEAALYDTTTGTWTTLGSLGSSSGTNASATWAMTPDAKTIVGNAWINAGTADAIIIQNGTVTDLGTAYAGHSTRAESISNDGSIYGGYQEQPDGFWQGSIWSNGTQTLLNDASGNPLSDVSAISGNGAWAYTSSAYDNNAYKWSQSTGAVAFDNPFGIPMTVTGTNYDGSVVVGVAGDFFTGTQGWIWTAATGVESMNTYAASFGNYNGQALSDPLGVSQDGSYITGIYTDSFGFPAGSFVIHTQAAPEPVMLVALAAGIGALLIRKRS